MSVFVKFRNYVFFNVRTSYEFTTCLYMYVCMYVYMQAKVQASNCVVLFPFCKTKHRTLPTIYEYKPTTQ